jgi:hypothetical protein
MVPRPIWSAACPESFEGQLVYPACPDLRGELRRAAAFTTAAPLTNPNFSPVPRPRKTPRLCVIPSLFLPLCPLWSCLCDRRLPRPGRGFTVLLPLGSLRSLCGPSATSVLKPLPFSFLRTLCPAFTPTRSG